MGVDFASVNRMTRGLLVSAGIMPEGVALVSKDQWELGNQMGVLKEDYLDTLEWMSEELEMELEEKGPIIPIDKMDCKVVYSINPREVKYDPRTIADAAKIFHVAGENWTMPSEGWDMTNFGLFSGDDDLGGAVARRLYEKVIELRGNTLVISECGHAYRVMQYLYETWAKEELPFRVTAMVEIIARLIREGRIEIPSGKERKIITYHDPCHLTRGQKVSPELPRKLLKMLPNISFIEMSQPDLCCGAGGGMRAGNLDLSLKIGRKKVDMIRETKAEIVTTNCPFCQYQLRDLLNQAELKEIEILSVIELLDRNTR